MDKNNLNAKNREIMFFNMQHKQRFCKEIENEMKHDSVRQMNLTYRANGEKMHRKKIEMETNKAINDLPYSQYR